MSKIVKSLAVVSALLACVVLLMFILSLDKQGESITDEQVIEVSEMLVLANFKDNYAEVIAGLPDCVQDSVKAELTARTAVEWQERALYGSIKPLEVVIYDTFIVRSKDIIHCVVQYKELQLFNMVMTTIVSLDVKEGKVWGIEASNYTNSSDFKFE